VRIATERSIKSTNCFSYFISPVPHVHGQVRTENSNNPHGFGFINPEIFSPFPKNPVIARFFREIGRADELGSGVRKLMKYGRAYGGSDPKLVEGDVFRSIVKYPDSAIYEKDSTVTPQVTPQVIRLLNVLKEGEFNRGLLEIGDAHKIISFLFRINLFIFITSPFGPGSVTKKEKWESGTSIRI
jgi:hypothetical protein